MDFDFDDDQELLRSTTRSFIEKRSSLATRRPAIEEPEVFDRAVWQEGAQLGWTSLLVPGEHDGGSVSSQPIVDLVVLAEEFGRTLQPGPLLPTNVVADAIAGAGSTEQRRTHLPGIVSGHTVAAWCMSADGTPDPEAIGVRADTAADGCFVLNGAASYVQGATVADLLLVTATSDDGPLQLLVLAASNGITVRPLVSLDLTRRFGEVLFDAVVVPPESVLATREAATTVHERAVALATVLQAAEAVGAAEHLFATTLQYSKDRIQFGRPIGSFQAIKHRMADLATTVEAMRAATHDAALSLADRTPDADDAVATAGSYVTEAHAFLCGECLQLSGGIGFTWEHDLHLFLRRAHTDEVLYGDPSWHRERLCRLITVDTHAKAPATAVAHEGQT